MIDSKDERAAGWSDPVPLLSIILPAHNEEDNVGAVHHELRRVLCDVRPAVEIIFVDDGSTDATAERVRDLAAKDDLCRLIRLTRNFGHQSALLAGLTAARGAAVVTMDCDLQHPPSALRQMIDAWRGGALIVQMIRSRTIGDTWFKRTSSRLYYKMISILSDQPVSLGPDFQLLDRQVVDTILKFRTSRPFLRGMVAWIGFPLRQFEFVADGRNAGRPSYSIRKMLGLALDGVTALSTKPLRAASYLGLLSATLCLCYAAFILFSYAQGYVIPGWTSVILALLFLGGVQLLTIGIVGEYVGRIYELARNVPPYLVLGEVARPEVSGNSISVLECAQSEGGRDFVNPKRSEI